MIASIYIQITFYIMIKYLSDEWINKSYIFFNRNIYIVII